MSRHPGRYQLEHHLTETPAVSAIVTSRGDAGLPEACLEGLLQGTDYPALDVTVVGRGAGEGQGPWLPARVQADPRVRGLAWQGPLNLSAMSNLAAASARGEYLLLLDDDVEVISPGWLGAMVAEALSPEVGAVGAKLLFPDRRVQHAGVLTGVRGIAVNACRHLTQDSLGYFHMPHLTRECSAASGACLLTRRGAFLEAGGLDADELPVAFNDIDYCLRPRRAGQSVVYCALAVLTHRESGTRDRDRAAAEAGAMLRRWSREIEHDPYYSPHLSREGPDFELRV